MPLSEEQIQVLFGSDAHFPARFPELAKLDVVESPLPAFHLPKREGGEGQEGAAPVAQPPLAPGLVTFLEVTETQDVLIKRVIPLSEVRSVFLPYDARRKKLDLDKGEWLIGPQIQSEQEAVRNLATIKEVVAQYNNPDGLGIVFVAESARILNVVSIAASADESGFIRDRLSLSRRDPCCYDPCCYLPEPCC